MPVKWVKLTPGAWLSLIVKMSILGMSFFCIHTFIKGFKRGCRPLSFLDETHLLGRYGRTLLGATSKDGNEGFFHLSFAIINNKMDKNRTWFVSIFCDSLYNKDDYDKITTFISDRSKVL